MGETMAETLRDPIEREKPNSSEATLEQSISFGRFENDLLSWERWSSFSQNKYLEEVGKCSTPGSVAKKKAYFEAHYKKIAAQKAEMTDQEQEIEDHSYGSDAPSNGNPTSNGCSAKLEFDKFCVDYVTSSTEPGRNLMSLANYSSAEEPRQDVIDVNCQGSSVGSVREEVDDLPDSPKSSEFEGAVLVKDDDVYIESQDHSEDMFELVIEDYIPLPEKLEQVEAVVQDKNDLIGSRVKSEEAHQLDNETSHVSEGKTHQLDNETSHVQEDKTYQLDNETTHVPGSKTHQLDNETSHVSESKTHLLDSQISHAQESKTEDAKSKQQKQPQKKTPVSKDRNLVKTKKKPVTPTGKTLTPKTKILVASTPKTPVASTPKTPVASTPKTPVASTPKTTRTSLSRASKLTPPSPVILTSKISTRKESNASLLIKSSPLATKQKPSTTNNAMHTSLTLAPLQSDSANPAPARRSFIMEKMGDKDIVKRAFRAFQNNSSLSNTSIEEKSSTPIQLSAKRTAGVASTSLTPQKDKERVKAVENTGSRRKQVGGRPNSASARPVSEAGRLQRSAKGSQPHLGVGSDERAERRKEISKKLEKSKAEEVDRPRLRSESKEKQEAETKKLTRSLDIKATPTRFTPRTTGI